MNRSLRFRLTLIYTALFAALFVASALLLYGVLSRSLYRQLDDTLASEAETAAGLLADEYQELGHNLEAAAREIVGDMKVHGDFVAVLERGRLVAAKPSLSLAEAEGPRRRTADRRVVLDGRECRVLVSAPLDSVNAAQAALARGIAIGLPLALAASALGAWLLSTRALRPLASFAQQTRAITENSLSTRIEAHGAVAELEVLIASMNDLLSRLDRSFDALRRFVADASHELRTPISIIRGEADVVLSRERSAAEYRDALALILDESRRLSVLVDDLLNLARADGGRLRLDLREFYLDELLAACCRQYAAAARAKSQELQLLPSRDVQYRGDETLLRRLVLNLLDNAVRYTPEGGRIEVSLEHDSSSVRLWVADTGIGIAPEHAPHVFERFYRTDEARSRAHGGFGLGLSIVQWIAEAHHGTVACASQPGTGSRFTVTLPILQS